jgi:hypothetical protein
MPAEIIPFDRFWRAGHPMHPRTTPWRRWSAYFVLTLLVGLIGGYAYITDSNRVRRMAESYLSEMLGQHVQVRRATLSIFEGLRLDDVKIRLTGEPNDQPPIFSADTFVIRYSLRQLLAGRIEATQIIAKRPHVQLTQDLDSLLRSYHKVVGAAPSLPATERPSVHRPPPFPEISLRDARVDYRETRPDGSTSFGTLALEGQFSPAEGADRYNFSLQTRGMSEKMGPYIEGSISLASGRITAQLRNFELGQDIRLMLPAPVRQWWEQHELAGKVDINELSYVLPHGQSEAKFTVRTALQGVTLLLRPGELMSTDESDRVASVRDTIETMGSLYRIAGYQGLGPWQPVSDLLTSAPIRLDDMAGGFVFSEDGIRVQAVQADIEGNRIFIDGNIRGYPGRPGLPEPPATLHITSGGKVLTFPASPAYTNSLPHALREIYDQLRPEGTCKLDVTIARSVAGGKISVDGEIDILDGNFIFLRFPYPVRHAGGKIVFSPASGTAPERLELNLHGLGILGGPNEKTMVHVTGLMGPLGNDAGVAIRVASDEVFSEETLTNAFPIEVQRTLRMFGAEGKGQSPTFHGSFTCDVNRAVGPDQPWLLFTHVKIDSGTGALAAFPYPLKDLAMELKIGEDHVDIINAHMNKGPASLRVDGKVTWAPQVRVRVGHHFEMHRTNEPTIVSLTVSAHDLPIDQDLLDALPADRRQWIEELGLSGKLDINGTVRSETQARPIIPANRNSPLANSGPVDSALPEMAYDLDLTLHDGTVWPRQGTFAVSDVTGKFKLTPQSIELVGLKGRREDATLGITGEMEFGDTGTSATLRLTADNMTLDPPLYAILPKAGQQAWDQLRPKGTLDAIVDFTGPIGAVKPGATPPSEHEKVILKPRQMAVNPKVFPYALDHVTGTVVVDDGKTTLENITAKHGEGTLKLSGNAEEVGKNDVWTLALEGKSVTVDKSFITAMPAALAESLGSMGLKGKVDWAIPRFVYTAPHESADPTIGTIDIAGKIMLDHTDLDVGVSLAGVTGTLTGRGVVENGRTKELHGQIDVASMTAAGRPVTNFHGTVDRDAGSDETRLAKMAAVFADGDIAGNVTLTSPAKGPSRYSIDMVLRDADAAIIAHTEKAGLKGQLSASLGLEGIVDDPKSRRGRGDVLVNGQGMYELPVVLGLLQITNLALPINHPFTEGSARFNVDGQRVTFDNISLSSKSMRMQGEGHLDFDTKKVAMTFTTDNPRALQIPFISDIWRNAQKELFKIEVRGTVQSPKVTARSFNTVTTTVDEVFNHGKKQ